MQPVKFQFHCQVANSTSLDSLKVGEKYLATCSWDSNNDKATPKYALLSKTTTSWTFDCEYMQDDKELISLLYDRPVDFVLWRLNSQLITTTEASPNTHPSDDSNNTNQPLAAKELRPKTPLMPHHYTSPEAHILEYLTSLNMNHSNSTSLNADKNASNQMRQSTQSHIDGPFVHVNTDSRRLSLTMPPNSRYRKAEVIGQIRLNLRKFFWHDSTEISARVVIGNYSDELLFTAQVTVDIPVLSLAVKSRLKPLCLTVHYLGDIPPLPQNSSICVAARCFDGCNIVTDTFEASSSIKFQSQHIILSGLLDKDLVQRHYNEGSIYISVHVPQESTDMSENTCLGVASLKWKEFLNSSFMDYKLRIQTPLNKQQDIQWLHYDTVLKISLESFDAVLLPIKDNVPQTLAETPHTLVEAIIDRTTVLRHGMIHTKSRDTLDEIITSVRKQNILALGYSVESEGMFDKHVLSKSERADNECLVTGGILYDRESYYIFLECRNATWMEQINSAYSMRFDVTDGVDVARIWNSAVTCLQKFMLNATVNSLLAQSSTYVSRKTSRSSLRSLELLSRFEENPDESQELNMRDMYQLCMELATENAELLVVPVGQSLSDLAGTSEDRPDVIIQSESTSNLSFEKVVQDATKANLSRKTQSPTKVKEQQVYTYSNQKSNTAEKDREKCYRQLARNNPRSLFDLNNRPFPIGLYYYPPEDK